MSTAERPGPDAPLEAALRQEIETVVQHAEYKRAASTDALKLVQKRFGYISDTHLAEVAALLGMTPAELDAVATFYNLIFRRPVGRHVILLCDSVACWVMGEAAARAQLRERLGIKPGETTADGRFTLLPIVCLGHCDHAPAMMVDEDQYGDLNAARLDAILERYK
ncbi:MAG TPA: NADH-quinone oxidoreductase subunit NuoE [Acidocella sp.]|jgi:NADH-quinone oxidoreductase subunit E|nr:NADH-quinone oxidoreductase subunit NuoE [Acidocella sp.]OYV51803.1 MAG: NADH-quinone oxidoreductase subunit E [Acidocella sp. 20-58-15]HQT40321.1 NADH-quinone oxidoreductase subunit NuoE [Acidocella sp.]